MNKSNYLSTHQKYSIRFSNIILITQIARIKRAIYNMSYVI